MVLASSVVGSGTCSGARCDNCATLAVEESMNTEEKRIYCVVAQTVQHPLEVETFISLPCCEGSTRSKYVRGENTRTIVQVPGRIAAQVGHAVSKMRYNLLAHEIEEASVKAAKANKKRSFGVPPFQPITTIVLGARDSFELDHVYRLLRDVAGILT